VSGRYARGGRGKSRVVLTGESKGAGRRFIGEQAGQSAKKPVEVVLDELPQRRSRRPDGRHRRCHSSASSW
jgi:hypothetical protein